MQRSKRDTRVDTFRCPQCGRVVKVSAKYRANRDGTTSLVDFGCSMEGMCGSPMWDPCPMYLASMERTRTI